MTGFVRLPVRRLVAAAACASVGTVAPLLSQPQAEGTAAALALSGTDRAVLELPQGARFEDVERYGYRLRIDPAGGGRARVEVQVQAWQGSERLADPLPAAGADATLVALAEGLGSGARDRFEASRRVQSWMARNIEYRLDRSEDQSAREVLERRSGYCTGVARLAVELLRLVGVPAREVPGLVFDGPQAGYHRWIEVELSPGQWLFSDPLRYHHFVPASYVPLASEIVFSGAPTLRTHSREKTYRLSGALTDGPAGVFGVAANSWSGHVVELRDPERLVARLGGTGRLRLHLQGARWRRVVELPGDLAAGFAGLASGAYQLRVEWSREPANGDSPGRALTGSWMEVAGPVAIELSDRRPREIWADELIAERSDAR